MPHARVLVVDDDATTRTGLDRLLRAEGFAVECASDGSAALERATRQAPDVVFTDLQMPGLTGIELCRKLHERDAHLPVILITSFGDLESAVSGLRAGADDFLTKPLDFDVVLWSLRRAIDKRAAAVERDQARDRALAAYEHAVGAARQRDEVLSVIAHDLRNPIGVIEWSAQYLLGSAPCDVNEATRRILRSVGRMKRLLENLLDDVRLREGRLEIDAVRHSASDLLEDVRELRPLAIQRSIRLDVQPAAEDASVICDRTRMGQVLSNLVANAIKFSPSRGTVTVRAESIDGEARFVVQDEGPGIEADDVPRLFERYWQSSHGAARTGVGLGLFIAKQIVDAHGGRIWVERRKGGGSTFYVALRSGARLANTQAADAAAGRRERVVEDVKPLERAEIGR